MMLALRTGALAMTALVVLVVSAAAEDKETTKEKRREKLIAREGAVEVVLLRHKAIREDLKLSDEQAKKIHDFTSTQWKKAQEVQDLAKDKQEERWKEMTKENQQFLHKTLSAAQRHRLHQIGMQLAGLLWITRPDIAKKLELTGDQKKKIHQLQHTAHEEMVNVIHGSGSKKEKEEKIRELSRSNRTRMEGVLTDEQKSAWKKMVGEPFKGDLSQD